MPTADMTILFVENPIKSLAFYSSLFTVRQHEVHPSFVLLVFENGFQLALWSRFTAEPLVTAPAGGCEVMFTVASKDALEALYLEWGVTHGVTIYQKPTLLDFGYTFVALDPDGHRLRVAYLRDA
ncbi:VOC family protein [Zymobacter sp. IVIA_5232.4 C2]|uniref:VOC family protein n=1 Tax=Zymobacter sp. IVIA_5232.4 C2 TaxID=3394855 RepID=UPI0039C19D11